MMPQLRCLDCAALLDDCSCPAPKTLQERVVNALSHAHYPFTATQLRGYLDALNPHGTPVKLSTLSSLLNTMTKDDTLTRTDDYGVRGGYGYMLKVKT